MRTHLELIFSLQSIIKRICFLGKLLLQYYSRFLIDCKRFLHVLLAAPLRQLSYKDILLLEFPVEYFH